MSDYLYAHLAIPVEVVVEVYHKAPAVKDPAVDLLPQPRRNPAVVRADEVHRHIAAELGLAEDGLDGRDDQRVEGLDGLDQAGESLRSTQQMPIEAILKNAHVPLIDHAEPAEAAGLA